MLLRSSFLGRLACCIAALALISLGGCPSPTPNLPLSGVLTTLLSTGAVVGQQGSLRISVGDPVDSNTNVSLSSSNSSVASIAGSATIQTGSAVVEVPFEGLAPGTATLSASLNGVTLTTVVRVVPSLQVTSIYGPGRTLQVGASSSVTASLNITTPQNVTINLNSSNSGIVNVPGNVVVPPFSSGASAAVAAGGVGSAAITATLNSSSQTVVINTTATPLLNSISLPTRQQVGGTNNLSIYLDSIVATDTAVALLSSNAAAISLPATATVPAGNYYLTVPYSAAAAGATTITASLNGSQRAINTEVVTTPAISYFSGLSNRQVFGSPLALNLYLDAVVAADTTVALASSQTGVATVPASVVVPAGSNSTLVPITGVAIGSTILSATLGTSTETFALTLVSGPTINSINAPTSTIAGSVFDLSVYLDAPATTDTSVTLTSSNPAVVNVPATILVPAGSTSSQQTTVNAISPGTTTISASLNGSTRSTATSVLATPSITDLSLTSRLQTGALASLSIYTDVAPLADTPIGLTSTNAAVLNVPATAILQAGNTYLTVPVTAGAIGDAFVTATLGTSGQSAGTTVVATPVISSVYVGQGVSKFQVGAFGQIYLSFDAGAAADTTVTIANSAPGVLSAPTSAVLSRGDTFVSIPFNALAVGISSLTVTAFGSSRSVTIEVTNTPGLNYVYASPVPLVGGFGLLTVSLDTVVAGDTVVTLTQDNPAALSIPAVVVIGTNTSSAAVNITGLANALTNVTATLGADTTSTAITPTVP